MKILKTLFINALLCIPSVALADPLPFGVGWMGYEHWKESSSYRVPHKDEAIMSLHGRVEEINKTLSVSRFYPDTSLQVQTGTGVVTVILAPAWYLSGHFPKILPGDEISVKGSRVLFREADTILAGEVGKGNEVLKLRDDKGRPLWTH